MLNPEINHHLKFDLLHLLVSKLEHKSCIADFSSFTFSIALVYRSVNASLLLAWIVFHQIQIRLPELVSSHEQLCHNLQHFSSIFGMPLRILLTQSHFELTSQMHHLLLVASAVSVIRFPISVYVSLPLEY